MRRVYLQASRRFTPPGQVAQSSLVRNFLVSVYSANGATEIHGLGLTPRGSARSNAVLGCAGHNQTFRALRFCAPHGFGARPSCGPGGLAGRIGCLACDALPMFRAILRAGATFSAGTAAAVLPGHVPRALQPVHCGKPRRILASGVEV